MKHLHLFSGTSNQPLSSRIASLVDTNLSRVEITRFLDNECRVQIVENDVSDGTSVVIQSLSEVADQNLMELCLIGQALKSMKAPHVTAVIPWLGYSKQDKEFRKGEAVSAQLVAKFIETAGFDEVITLELHSENLIPFFHIPVTELSTQDLLSQLIDPKNGQAVVVSPDKGGKSRSEIFAKKIGLPIAYLSKQRDLSTGEVTIQGIDGEVDGNTAIIYDDIINTGETAVHAAEFLKKKGAKEVIVLATHAVLAGNAENRLEKSAIDRIVVTDTIDVPKEKRFAKLEIVSVASLITEALKVIV